MKTTEKKNRMIDAFMGHKVPHWYPKYDTSWDWLMPVVEKIEGMGFSVKIQRLKTSIHPLCEDKELFGIVCGDVSKKLEITYDTIVQFIEFYNEQK
jgi:hypothetical protein